MRFAAWFAAWFANNDFDCDEMAVEFSDDGGGSWTTNTAAAQGLSVDFRVLAVDGVGGGVCRSVRQPAVLSS